MPRLRGSPLVGSVRELRRDYLGTISRPARLADSLQIAMLEIPIVIAAVLQAFTLQAQLTSIPVHAAIRSSLAHCHSACSPSSRQGDPPVA